MEPFKYTYTDEELVALIKEGDRNAFAELFDRYQALLYRFTYKKILQEDSTKDIIQDVFISMWRNRETLDTDSPIKFYLFKAVNNRSLDWLKSNAIRREYVNSFQFHLETVYEHTDYRVREADMKKIIATEINALPDRMRTVIYLRQEQALSNKEIAKNMGITEQTVETHFKRAFRVLRARLKSHISTGALWISCGIPFGI